MQSTLIDQIAYINMLFFTLHIIRSSNNTQNSPNLGSIYNMAPLGPFTVRRRITVIPKHTTKPEDNSPGIKTKPKPSLGLPENSFKNSVWSVQKQSKNFNPSCPKTIPKFSSKCYKTIPKIPKNSYTQSKKFGTEIYNLSRPLSQSQAIKWPLG